MERAQGCPSCKKNENEMKIESHRTFALEAVSEQVLQKEHPISAKKMASASLEEKGDPRSEIGQVNKEENPVDAPMDLSVPRQVVQGNPRNAGEITKGGEDLTGTAIQWDPFFTDERIGSWPIQKLRRELRERGVSVAHETAIKERRRAVRMKEYQARKKREEKARVTNLREENERLRDTLVRLAEEIEELREVKQGIDQECQTD